MVYSGNCGGLWKSFDTELLEKTTLIHAYICLCNFYYWHTHTSQVFSVGCICTTLFLGSSRACAGLAAAGVTFSGAFEAAGVVAAVPEAAESPWQPAGPPAAPVQQCQSRQHHQQDYQPQPFHYIDIDSNDNITEYIDFIIMKIMIKIACFNRLNNIIY